MAKFWVAQFSQVLFSCFLTNFKICAKRFCFAHVFLTLEIPSKQNCASHRRAHFNEILKMKINYIFTPNTLSIFVFKKYFQFKSASVHWEITVSKWKNDVFTQITPSISREKMLYFVFFVKNTKQICQKRFNIQRLKYFLLKIIFKILRSLLVKECWSFENNENIL